MTTVSTLLSSPDFGPVYTGVIGAAQSDPAVAEALARDIIEPRVIACRTRLERARDQGQVRADADLDAAVELLYGPIYHRLLLRTRPLSPDQVTTVLELAFGGLGPKRSRPASRARRAPAIARKAAGGSGQAA
jgi:hypothetical protein